MKTIVIISEDYIFLKLLEPILKKKTPDSKIIHCDSFEQVKSKVNKSDCHLIVADGVMSGVASFEIINYLRIVQRIVVPIFFISEVNNEYFKTKAYEVGASVYYTKPFNPFELTDAIVNSLKQEK